MKKSARIDYTTIKNDFKTNSDLVEYCLENFPETRESDKQLFLKAWALQGWRLSPAQQNAFLTLTTLPETLRRCRQLFHAKGLYMPDPVKTAQRSLLGMAHRKLHRTIKAEGEPYG